MKALHHDRFGPLDRLELRDLDIPTPGPGQVLIRVRAAGVNPGDRHAIRGVPYAARLMGYGVRRPRNPVPGQDLAGTVEAVGDGVDDLAVDHLAVGDEVFGFGTGTFAEYAVADAALVRPRPDRLTVEQAAAVPTAATAALQALRNVAGLTAGQQVLVIGASGGVGTHAVQIAKADGAEVTAVAGPRNLDLVRSAGADHVVDYSVEAIDEPPIGGTRPERFDVVVDLVGRIPLRRAARLLTPGGTFVAVGGKNPDSLTGMGRFVGALATGVLVRRRLRPLFSRPDGDDLGELARLLDEGRILPVIDGVYDLPGAVDALRSVEAGHSRGKVVLAL